MASTESQAIDIASKMAPPISAGQLDTDFDSFLTKMASKEAENHKELESKLEPVVKDIELREPPQPPTLASLPDEASAQRSPIENFGSAAMWITTLGSLFTRQPFMNSIAATTGALNAARQNDIENFNKQLAALKVHNENAEKTANFELETYKAALDKDKDIASAYTSMFKDENMQALVNAKMVSEAMKDKETQINNAIKFMPYKMWESSMKAKYPNFTSEDYFQNPAQYPDGPKLFQEMTNKGYATKELSEQGLTDEEYDQKYKNSPEITQLAEAYATGATLQQIVPGWGKDNPKRDAVERKAYELHPDLNWAEAHNRYVAEQSESRSLGTQVARIDLASNMLDNSLPSMMVAAKKVGLTPSTDINKVYNEAKRHLSNTDFSNFSTQLRAVTSDYAQFIGRGRLTVHSDEEALRILNEDMGITSLQGFVDAVQTERGNINKAIKETKDNAATGKEGSSTAPKGVDPDLWNHMTPEEQKLWQTKP